MAKFSQLKRMGLLLNKLNDRQGTRYVPAEDLLRHIENFGYGSEYGEGEPCSLRTLQRDFKTIDQLFGITIKHCAGRGYYIAERDHDANADSYEALLINFEMLSSIDQDSTLQKYVLPEHRRPALHTDFGLMLEALRRGRVLEFRYTLVRHGHRVVEKRVQPYFLKESQQRWYLIGFEADEKGRRMEAARPREAAAAAESAAKAAESAVATAAATAKPAVTGHPATGLKSFAVDRISDLAIDRSQRFKRLDAIDRTALFQDCFGIWNDPAIPVEEIILRYDTLDASFLKTFPLHTSQEILEETDTSVTLRVRLRVTNDFVMELLKRSRSVEVLQPLSLRRRLHEVYAAALNRNAGSPGGIEAAGNARNAGQHLARSARKEIKKNNGQETDR